MSQAVKEQPIASIGQSQYGPTADFGQDISSLTVKSSGLESPVIGVILLFARYIVSTMLFKLQLPIDAEWLILQVFR
jgi:hypothetical protein